MATGLVRSAARCQTEGSSQGSTETTFYVLTLYCGAAGIRDVRHALAACLIGDFGGLLGATLACHLFFG